MAFFGIVNDKCFYCRMPIEKGKEHTADVKVSGYTGTFNKKFCSEEHAENYGSEIQSRAKSTGGSCCH